MRHGAVLVHAPGLAASRVEEAAGRSWASATGRAAPPEVSIRPRGRGKGYRGGQLDAAWAQSAPSPPLLPHHRPLLAPRASPRHGPFLLPLHYSPSSCPVPTAALPRAWTRLQGPGWASVPGGQTPTALHPQQSC